MFTGLVEEIGVIQQQRIDNGAHRLKIRAAKTLDDLKVDESIAVNGVCLTAISVTEQDFEVQAVGETLRKSTLGELKQGARVNLERSLRFSDRLGGHLVQGHVDGVGTVTATQKQPGGTLLSLRVPESLRRYVISEGSIAVNGVSLTVARLSGSQIIISLIPHTLEATNLGELGTGHRVNIEVDLIGKYVESLLGGRSQDQMTTEWLQKSGYGR